MKSDSRDRGAISSVSHLPVLKPDAGWLTFFCLCRLPLLWRANEDIWPLDRNYNALKDFSESINYTYLVSGVHAGELSAFHF